MTKQAKGVDIISQIRENLRRISIANRRTHPFDMDLLWKMFKFEFETMFGKEFLVNDDVRNNILPIFYYFLENENFFKCKNLITDESGPSFEKGLLLFGSVGVGKTYIMRVFEKIFMKYSPHRFKIFPTYEVVDKYESINTPADKDFFYQTFTKGSVLFDDLNSEKMANNYGHFNVMNDILIRRCDARCKTHITLNPPLYFNGNIKDSLLKLGDDYDQRMVDRLFEMCNVVVFTGKSLRR